MRQFGAWCNFYQALTLPYDAKPESSQKVMLTMADHNTALPRYPGPIKILDEVQSQGDGLYEVQYTLGGTALGQVEGIYYDELSGKTLSYLAEIPEGQSCRTVKYILPQTALTEAQMRYQTQVVADSLALRQKQLSGAFQGLFMQAGEVIQVEDDKLGINGDYVLCEVGYQFNKSNDQDKNLYQQQHQFKAYPLSINYREALLDEAGETPALYRAPRYQGVMPGVFALTQGAYTVMPDALGSIPLWLPYNYWYTCKDQPCRYTRVISQANQGGKSGVSFPYYQDTEFVLMFVNGDLDRPVIKGTAANHLTGHLHNQSVQQRSALALPQGQHLLYSNVAGDQNFLKLGATHNEGGDETHMLLSNYLDPVMPGAKKLDYQQATTQSYERVTNNNFLHQSGGNQTLRTEEGAVPAKTYLLIQLCDQTNMAQPAHKPMLTDYLSNVTADLIITQNSGQVSKLNDQTTDPDLQKTILPNNNLHLEESDCQNNKTTDNDGNVYYTVYIVILPPPALFNFRQNFYAVHKALPEDQQELYQTLQPYFITETYDDDIQETLSNEQLQFYKTQGDNVLLFIHGFHVSFGAYPSNFIQNTEGDIKIQGNFTLYRTQNFIQNRYGSNNNPQLSPTNLLYGTGAKNWLITMEYNLNKAFGFDDQDYSKYTRIIGVTWQGNPSNPCDYMAAVPMSEFAAQKTFALVQQLTKAGIKVELMAHSLGNAVLARVLDLCGKNGVQIQHAHLWQPAIPNNALNTEAQNYLLILLPDPKGTEINLPANYDYTHARAGAKQITVMFSDQDTILGPVPKANADTSNQAVKEQEQKDTQAQTNLTLLQRAFKALNPVAYKIKADIHDELLMVCKTRSDIVENYSRSSSRLGLCCTGRYYSIYG
jgi:Alpha/beta hydrolase of unknown function (DUF900)